jgi:hypothetical protein
MFLNISWPRAVFEQRFLDWSVAIASTGLLIIGLVIHFTVRGRITLVDVDAMDHDEQK